MTDRTLIRLVDQLIERVPDISEVGGGGMRDLLRKRFPDYFPETIPPPAPEPERYVTLTLAKELIHAVAFLKNGTTLNPYYAKEQARDKSASPTEPAAVFAAYEAICVPEEFK